MNFAKALSFDSSASSADCLLLLSAETIVILSVSVFRIPRLREVSTSPSMVALMENAAMLSVADALPEGFTTVGLEMNVQHIKPSPIGAQITAIALLTAVEGRKLTFDVSAYDGEEQIGTGVHVRFMVDIERFMNKINR